MVMMTMALPTNQMIKHVLSIIRFFYILNMIFGTKRFDIVKMSDRTRPGAI